MAVLAVVQPLDHLLTIPIADQQRTSCRHTQLYGQLQPYHQMKVVQRVVLLLVPDNPTDVVPTDPDNLVSQANRQVAVDQMDDLAVQ